MAALFARLRKVTTLAGAAAGSTDGKGEAVRFGHIEGMTMDGAGNLYVADADNGTIRKIEIATANVTTIIGMPATSEVKLGPLPGGLSRPFGVAVSPVGDIFVTDPIEDAALGAR